MPDVNTTREGIPYSAAVLAGGLASRFGRDKARYPYRGKPLMAWVLESLAGASERFIVANRPYPEFALPCYADLRPGAGSLSGLHSALVHARCEWLALAACDLPFLTPAYWQHLAAARGEAPIVVAQNAEGALEPLAAFYHRSLLPLVEQHLDGSDFALHRLIARVSAEVIAWQALMETDGISDRLFLNANRLEDLP
jgi:molybdopterin-guanine dinucleotide biosynthesis protein A